MELEPWAAKTACVKSVGVNARRRDAAAQKGEKGRESLRKVVISGKIRLRI